jgi:hypothetical protein
MEPRKRKAQLTPARVVSDKQIAALKYLIAHSRYANNFCKRLCFWLIDHSQQLTKSVSVSIRIHPQDTMAADGAHNMVSNGCTTHLNAIMHAMGTEFHFSHHGGTRNVEGLLEGSGGYTFWLSPDYYDRQATQLHFNIEVINQIKLARSGLYGNGEDDPEPEEMGRDYSDKPKKDGKD